MRSPLLRVCVRMAVSSWPRLLCKPSSTTFIPLPIKKSKVHFFPSRNWKPCWLWCSLIPISWLHYWFKQLWEGINDTEVPCLASNESYNPVGRPTEDIICISHAPGHMPSISMRWMKPPLQSGYIYTPDGCVPITVEYLITLGYLGSRHGKLPKSPAHKFSLSSLDISNPLYWNSHHFLS